MCEMLDRMINKGKIEGIQEGKLQGIQEGKIQMILKMYQKNFTLEQIAMVAEKNVEEIKAIIKAQGFLLS